LQGDAGNDLLNGGLGIDTAVFAGAVATTVNLALATAQNTGHGQDRLVSIEDVITGGAADVLRGNAAANTLTGNGGNDRLFGGAGSDVLSGGGNDSLAGWTGDDSLDGGAGADTFSYFSGSGHDTIFDFEDGVDVILIDLSTAASLADITVTDLGANTEISFADVTITLLNFDHLLIGAGDFLFD
jgi:Ca2+-binding RTX toxin-like protein